MSNRILVVEDPGRIARVLRDRLAGSGYTVIEAGDGECGVAKVRSKNGPEQLQQSLAKKVPIRSPRRRGQAGLAGFGDPAFSRS